MFRCMYSKEYFGRMQLAALEDWQLLEEAAAVSLLKRHGLLFYGDVDTGETVQVSSFLSVAHRPSNPDNNPERKKRSRSFIEGWQLPVPIPS